MKEGISGTAVVIVGGGSLKQAVTESLRNTTNVIDASKIVDVPDCQDGGEDSYGKDPTELPYLRTNKRDIYRKIKK